MKSKRNANSDEKMETVLNNEEQNSFNEEMEDLIPPENFAIVENGLFRSKSIFISGIIYHFL